MLRNNGTRSNHSVPIFYFIIVPSYTSLFYLLLFTYSVHSLPLPSGGGFETPINTEFRRIPKPAHPPSPSGVEPPAPASKWSLRDDSPKFRGAYPAAGNAPAKVRHLMALFPPPPPRREQSMSAPEGGVSHGQGKGQCRGSPPKNR